jgi:hypothetical protein
MLDTVTATLARIEAAQRRAEAVAVPPRGTALDFLRAIYHNDELPLRTRMAAATAALPFETPKLSATAFVPMGEGFARRLEQAVARSRTTIIEHRPRTALAPEILEPSRR